MDSLRHGGFCATQGGTLVFKSFLLLVLDVSEVRLIPLVP